GERCSQPPVTNMSFMEWASRRRASTFVLRKKTSILHGSICRKTSRESAPRLRRSEEHTSELQSRENLVCRLLLEKRKPPGPSPAPVRRPTVSHGPATAALYTRSLHDALPIWREVFPAASYQYVLYGMGFKTESQHIRLTEEDINFARKHMQENQQRIRTLVA